MAGVTNMAFSGSRDQINASISSTYNFLAPPSGIPPPPIYTDDMLVKFPPKIAPSPRRPPYAPSSGSHAATRNDDTVRRDGTAGDGVTAPTFVTSRDNATNVTNAASSPRVAASPVRSQRGPETPTRGGNVGRDGTAGLDSTSVRDDAPERDDVTNPEGAPVALALVSSSGGPALVHAFTPLQDCPTPGDVPDSGGSGTAGATVEQESSTPRCDAQDITSPAPPTDTPDPNAQAD
ncbi:hypothetical protein BaRGS_00021716 [Batillaria attramentaria]|uniref:Uncharacterized protein n=1 Tax=Batillaria attramentaria TaxID=370345 RepID=A0ABD0KIJ8_9CAEN